MTVRASHCMSRMCESRQRGDSRKRPRPQSHRVWYSPLDHTDYKEISKEIQSPSEIVKRPCITLVHPPNPLQVCDINNTVTSHCRDEIVAAILTIVSALGLSKETLYMCVNLLDRYLMIKAVEVTQLETISITFLWIAIKFVETPETIAEKSIKKILKQRSSSGHVR